MSGIVRVVAAAAMGVLVAGSASAEGMTAEEFDARFAGLVGHLGGQFGGTYVREADDPDRDDGFGIFGAVDLALAYRGAGGFTFGIEGAVRYDYFWGEIVDFYQDYDVPALQGVVALHALAGGGHVRAGVFAQVGASLPTSYNWDDGFAHWLGGLTGQAFLADNVLVYHQVAYGNSFHGDNGEGFVRGLVLRSGMTYFANPVLALNADFEFAASKLYIDNDDPGRHFGFAFGAQYQVGQSGLFVNAEAGYIHINATDEGDALDEITFAVGFDFVFGAQSVRDRWAYGIAIGSPRLPVRAEAWTEWID